MDSLSATPQEDMIKSLLMTISGIVTYLLAMKALFAFLGLLGFLLIIPHIALLLLIVLVAVLYIYGKLTGEYKETILDEDHACRASYEQMEWPSSLMGSYYGPSEDHVFEEDEKHLQVLSDLKTRVRDRLNSPNV